MSEVVPHTRKLINVSLLPVESNSSNSPALAVRLGEAETQEKRAVLIAETLAQKAAAILSTSKRNSRAPGSAYCAGNGFSYGC